MALDLDRGLKIRFHPSGMQVCTYIGDAKGVGANPGTYYDESGTVLDHVFAKQAGYDVEKDMRQRLYNERMAKYRAQLDAEMRSEEDALAQAYSKNGNYDVRHIGAGQYAIFDKDGKRMTRVAMTKADVELLVGPLPADPNDPAAPPLEA